jgi:pimeloyl-ACP methyl ester carboxylesterase
MSQRSVFLIYWFRGFAMSRFAVNCFLTIMVAIGASSATFARQENPGTQEKVYLLRGLTNVLSPGIDQLANDLHDRNISATVSNHLFWNSLAAEAIQDCRSGRVDSIVLVGHSLGASAAVSMAEQLQQAGIRVALIVTFDPVIKASVPSNVHLLENFYLSSGLGVPVQRGEKFHGLLRNVDLGHTELGHLSVTTSASIQKQVMNDIIAAAKTRCR